MTNPTTEDLLRELAPRVLGALIHKYRNFDACEDATQEALLEASLSWPKRGIPDNPRGWLMTVATRRFIDQLRGDEARKLREDRVVAQQPLDRLVVLAADSVPSDRDDTLVLLFLCCHPALTQASQVALTLRAVGGLTTAEIAQAFLVPEATMAQRISRAKQRIKSSGTPVPGPDASPERIAALLHVLYLIFNEGYTATAGSDLHRAGLTGEAIRLTRMVHQLLPTDGEVTGLLALMLLTDARRPARTGPAGNLIPLAEQDRELWNSEAIAEGTTLIAETLARSTIGPYQVQAAIAAVHDEAIRAEDTDWRQILGLYEVLAQLSPGPVVTLNRAVAVAMVRGPRAGLDLLDTLADDPVLAQHHRFHAVRGHLLELTDDREAAIQSYRTAASRTTSLPERRYLEAQVAKLSESM